MEKYIPYDKLSKKKRRELDRKQRNDWGAVRPVSRKIESGKIYKRKKAKPEEDLDASPFFVFDCICGSGWRPVSETCRL